MTFQKLIPFLKLQTAMPSRERKNGAKFCALVLEKVYFSELHFNIELERIPYKKIKQSGSRFINTAEIGTR
jgi:hypothetical protein